MSLAELGSLGEFIGSIAVLVTLIYLALQIRQNTSAVQGANEKQVSAEAADFAAQIVADDELRDLWHGQQPSSRWTLENSCATC